MVLAWPEHLFQVGLAAPGCRRLSYPVCIQHMAKAKWACPRHMHQEWPLHHTTVLLCPKRRTGWGRGNGRGYVCTHLCMQVCACTHVCVCMCIYVGRQALQAAALEEAHCWRSQSVYCSGSVATKCPKNCVRPALPSVFRLAGFLQGKWSSNCCGIFHCL